MVRINHVLSIGQFFSEKNIDCRLIDENIDLNKITSVA